jgi:serine/threonine protein kinase
MNEQFRGYQLVTQLARKTKSSLYLAQPMTKPSEKVVIKIFDPLDAGVRQEYFYNEVDHLTQLRHPFLISLLDGGIEQDRPYLISSYAPNGSLRQRLKSIRPLSLEAAISPLSLEAAFLVLVQIGQALSYTHGWNVIHGHLKPENILFNTQDEAMLADFIPPSLLESYFPYSRPERERSSYEASEQRSGIPRRESDQYALGYIAYELLTGTLPFAAAGFSKGQFTHSYPVPPTQIVPTLPRYVDDAILKALANDPLKRHENVAAFIEALTADHVNVTMTPSPEMFLPLLAEKEGALARPSSLTGKREENVSFPARESIVVAAPLALEGEDGLPTMRERGIASPDVLVLSQPSNTPITENSVNAFQATQEQPLLSQTNIPARRSRKVGFLVGGVLTLACALILCVSLLSQFLLSSSKQGQSPTSTAPVITATKTQAQEKPVIQTTVTPSPTATPQLKASPSATVGASPTLAPPPPTAQPTSIPTPSPTPVCRCLLLCKC